MRKQFAPATAQYGVRLISKSLSRFLPVGFGYYGWYSNKMRGQRDKHAVEEAKAAA